MKNMKVAQINSIYSRKETTISCLHRTIFFFESKQGGFFRWLDALYPCVILFLLYGTTFGVPPLYYAIASPDDTAALFIWRTISVLGLYLTHVFKTFQQKSATLVLFFIVSCVVVGHNTYAVWDITPSSTLQVLSGVCAALLAAVYTRAAVPISKGWLWLCVWSGIVGVCVIHVMARVTAIRIICAVLECMWCVYVHLMLHHPSNDIWLPFKGIAVLLLLVPLSVMLSIIPIELQNIGNRAVNFAGQPVCKTNFPVLFPINMNQTKRIFSEYDMAWPVGARHSWSNASCPPIQSGVMVSTKFLTSIFAVSPGVYRVEAGVTIGTLSNYMFESEHMLSSTWHGAISIGGAIAGDIHNEGKRFCDMVDSVRVITRDGHMVNLTRHADSLFGTVCGNGGVIGLIYDAVINSVPLVRIIGQVKQFEDLEAAIQEWKLDRKTDIIVVGDTVSTRLYTRIPTAISPKHQEGVSKSAILTPVSFANTRQSFEFFNSFFHIISACFYPIVRPLMNHAIESYEMEYTWPYIYTTTNDLKTTLLAATDIDIIVPTKHLVACIRRIRGLEIAFQQRIRHCVDGADCAHLDFSVPVFLLHMLKSWLLRINTTCLPLGRHISKMTIDDALNFPE